MFKFLNNLDVYYINLEKDLERNIYMEQHLNEHEINNAVRINGIDGAKENILVSSLSFGESGCSLSHLKAIEYFYNYSDKEYAIICEDDLDISNIKKINFNFYDTLSFHNPEYYCLQLVCITREEMAIDFNLRKRLFWDFSTGAYILNKKYAKLLIDSYRIQDGSFKKFIPKEHTDPRGGTVYTRPVADELIYSLCETYIYPLFTVKNIGSSIDNNSERERQVMHSINLFNKKWSTFKKIELESFCV